MGKKHRITFIRISTRHRYEVQEVLRIAGEERRSHDALDADLLSKLSPAGQEIAEGIFGIEGVTCLVFDKYGVIVYLGESFDGDLAHARILDILKNIYPDPAAVEVVDRRTGQVQIVGNSNGTHSVVHSRSQAQEDRQSLVQWLEALGNDCIDLARRAVSTDPSVLAKELGALLCELTAVNSQVLALLHRPHEAPAPPDAPGEARE